MVWRREEPSEIRQMIKTAKLITVWMLIWLGLVIYQFLVPSVPAAPNPLPTVSSPGSVFRLQIKTSPAKARVRVMNIPDKYQYGMALPPGQYRIKVDAPGYQSKSLVLQVKAGQASDIFHVALERK